MGKITDGQIKELKDQEQRPGWLGNDPGADLQWLLDQKNWKKYLTMLREGRLKCFDWEWHALFGFLYNGQDPVQFEMGVGGHLPLVIDWMNYPLEPREEMKSVHAYVVDEGADFGVIWKQLMDEGWEIACPRAVGEWLRWHPRTMETSSVVGGAKIDHHDGYGRGWSFLCFGHNRNGSAGAWNIQCGNWCYPGTVWLLSKKEVER